MGSHPEWFSSRDAGRKISRSEVTISELVEGGGSRTIQGIDNTQLIDSRNCYNGQKGTTARFIVRLLYENAFALESDRPHSDHSIPWIRREWIGK